jgi:hypothetical protein
MTRAEAVNTLIRSVALIPDLHQPNKTSDRKLTHSRQ